MPSLPENLLDALLRLYFRVMLAFLATSGRISCIKIPDKLVCFLGSHTNIRGVTSHRIDSAKKESRNIGICLFLSKNCFTESTVQKRELS
jgi:hypothetical protein